ncbi:MAG: TonB family protein [Burkholderiaceae bacterium]|nr:TonB family protein [Burkholderiaceae bacterium]
MNLFAQNRSLSIAVLVSILAHGLLAFFHFPLPRTIPLTPTQLPLEVVLVNARDSLSPLNPAALSQTSTDGGGTAGKGQPHSPLPNSGKRSDGDLLIAAQQRLDTLQKQQKQLTEELKGNLPVESPAKALPQKDGRAAADGRTRQQPLLSDKVAAIERDIREQGSKPNKVHITPRTKEVGYAMYYKAMQRKIENVGTLNFPQRHGRKLYGELTVYIPVSSDGTLYEAEGGPRVERSSGNNILDRAALQIVRRAAPFGPFPPGMLARAKNQVWVIVTRFRFTREKGLETESQRAS